MLTVLLSNKTITYNVVNYMVCILNALYAVSLIHILLFDNVFIDITGWH